MRKGWVISILLAAACGGSSSSNTSGGGGGGGGTTTCTAANATATTTVSMANTAYAPGCMKVAVGTTVTFSNDDVMAHTVTTDAGQAESFNSGAINPNATFSHTFATAGTIKIHCNFHSTMHLTVIVQ
ncbi:cupredoxin domain-containing protein [Anaeromyxobacter oryzae]|uniref:EfeO-type cupredoxin-like domain-containing protein n=1 Tax=Anaeromyxobacter oryzae TaxID=2918170 RepID=A0ABM7WUJ9_9BACT|nr:cupredoxin domain-containing protein [Anaeromyxobacter oryzae]BDG03068.1 hypothetical protein AMOR_20640 [Anaeromyxobacter oryzae]